MSSTLDQRMRRTKAAFWKVKTSRLIILSCSSRMAGAGLAPPSVTGAPAGGPPGCQSVGERRAYTPAQKKKVRGGLAIVDPAVNERGAIEPPGRAPGGSAELLWLGAGGGGSKKKFTIYGVWRVS